MKRRLIQLNTLRELYRLEWLGESFVTLGAPASVSEEMPQNDEELRRAVSSCHLCALSKRRKSPCLGQGSGGGLMIVTDAPGAAQNERGNPFEGKSGELLYRMITGGLGLEAHRVYVTSLIKCHPFGKPPAEAIGACEPYLSVELELVKPKVILALGQGTFGRLCATTEALEAARGRPWPLALSSVIEAPVFASYSPAHLGFNPSAKKEAMVDLQQVKSYL